MQKFGAVRIGHGINAAFIGQKIKERIQSGIIQKTSNMENSDSLGLFQDRKFIKKIGILK